jgi:hypothetical protein
MKKEFKVYLVTVEDFTKQEKQYGKKFADFTDKEFAKVADFEGHVFTLTYFSHLMNEDCINTSDFYIRFIETDSYTLKEILSIDIYERGAE